MNPKTQLKIYGVPTEKMKELRSGNGHNKFAFDKEPADKYRLRKEETPFLKKVAKE